LPSLANLYRQRVAYTELLAGDAVAACRCTAPAKCAHSGFKKIHTILPAAIKRFLFSCYLRFLRIKILLDTGNIMGLLVCSQRVKFS
jgi:hypothetical protein